MVRYQADVLPESKDDGAAPVKERIATVVAIVEEGRGEVFLILGDGVSGFDRWRIDGDKVRKLVTEGLPIAIRQPSQPA